MTRRPGSGWLWAWLLLALLGAQGARADPPSHMIVYDASGSMYRTDTGESRFRLAQSVVARLAEAMRGKRVNMPTGLVIFGRQYFQALRRCDDIELAVPLAPGNLDANLDRIVA